MHHEKSRCVVKPEPYHDLTRHCNPNHNTITSLTEVSYGSVLPFVCEICKHVRVSIKEIVSSRGVSQIWPRLFLLTRDRPLYWHLASVCKVTEMQYCSSIDALQLHTLQLRFWTVLYSCYGFSPVLLWLLFVQWYLRLFRLYFEWELWHL